MTRREALLALSVGYVALASGLVWALGAWALVGSGLVLMVGALLIPTEKERREPADPAPSA